jgi:transposase
VGEFVEDHEVACGYGSVDEWNVIGMQKIGSVNFKELKKNCCRHRNCTIIKMYFVNNFFLLLFMDTKQRKYKRTTQDERNHILNLLENDVSMEKIAKSFKISVSTVSRIRTRFLNTNSTADAHRAPKHKKMSRRTFRLAMREFSKKKYQSLNYFRHILQTKYHVEYSRSGLRKYMKREGYNARIKRRKPLVSKVNRLRRIAFAKAHMNWEVEDWNKVIWTDETSFERIRRNQRQYFYAKYCDHSEEPFRLGVQKGGGSIMFWGCFRGDQIGFGRFLSGSVTKKQYQEVLNDEATQSLSKFACGDQFTFMHDNAPPHVAKETKELLDFFQWKTLQWPPSSPDLNPIENLWQCIKFHVYAGSEFHTIEELKDKVFSVWESFDRSPILTNLIRSMPGRMREVIRKNGQPIRY